MPWSGRPRLNILGFGKSIDFDSEHCPEALAAFGCDLQCAAVALTPEPVIIERRGAHDRTDMASDVKSPLGPVQAGAAEETTAARRIVDGKAVPGEESAALGRDFAAICVQRDMTCGLEPVGYGDGECPARWS